jgi:hypothetical protein
LQYSCRFAIFVSVCNIRAGLQYSCRFAIFVPVCNIRAGFQYLAVFNIFVAFFSIRGGSQQCHVCVGMIHRTRENSHSSVAVRSKYVSQATGGVEEAIPKVLRGSSSPVWSRHYAREDADCELQVQHCSPHSSQFYLL